MSTPKIEFRNVTKIFQTRSQQIIAVKDYSMQVESGDFVSIIGPSGCGKSTLIRMLDGIIQPTGGEILIDGNPLDTSKKLPKEILRKMPTCCLGTPCARMWRCPIVSSETLPVKARSMWIS